MSYRLDLGAQITRIGAVVTMTASVIWVQWPLPLSLSNVLLFLGALITWIACEVASSPVHSKEATQQNNILVDDVNKLNKLCSLFGSNNLYNLREVSFSDYMSTDYLDGIFKLIDYKQKDLLPFHNEKLQKSYSDFCISARKFTSQVVTIYTSDGNGRMTWRSPGQHWLPDDQYNKAREELRKLDDMATKLAKEWEGLILDARRELAGASVSISIPA